MSPRRLPLLCSGHGCRIGLGLLLTVVGCWVGVLLCCCLLLNSMRMPGGRCCGPGRWRLRLSPLLGRRIEGPRGRRSCGRTMFTSSLVPVGIWPDYEPRFGSTGFGGGLGPSIGLFGPGGTV